MLCSILVNTIFENGIFWKSNKAKIREEKEREKKLLTPGMISIIYISRFFRFFLLPEAATGGAV